MSKSLKIYRIDTSNPCAIPLARQGISCGFPSPAAEYLEEVIDLNHELIRDKEATFLGIAVGHSMVDANIKDGDVVVIDRSLEASNGSLVLCILNGEFTLKTLELSPKQTRLIPANPEYNPIEITPEMEFSIWGVVTYVIHKLKKS